MNIKTIKVGDYRTNCYLVSDNNKDAFLVDPGDEAEKILAEIEKYQLNLKFILLTHGHFDHVLAVDRIKEEYPNIDIFMNEKDIFLLDQIVEQGIYVKKFLHKFKSDVIAVKEGDLINHGDEIIKVIETPGHTPGGVCYLFGKDLFSGDTLFYHTFGRVDLPFSSSGDMKTSLEKIFKFDPALKIWPGHGQGTTIREELKFEDSYMNELDRYQKA